jgi:hypothetical protein
MPTIPNMSLPSTSIDASEIYQNGLFSPANPPQTVEVLNGGLEQSNYNGADGSIKPYMMDLGTFARGYSMNFSRREFVYARQLDSNYENHTIISASIATRLFLPFQARVIQFGFQCWFNHDASRYLANASPNEEFWRYKFEVLSTRSTTATENASKALTGRLPYGRQRAGTSPYSFQDYSVHEEGRWYYVSKTGMLSGLINKGYADFKLNISANILDPANISGPNDAEIAKCKLMSGTIWVLALR